MVMVWKVVVLDDNVFNGLDKHFNFENDTSNSNSDNLVGNVNNIMSDINELSQDSNEINSNSVVSEVNLSSNVNIDTQDLQYMLKVVWIWKGMVKDNNILNSLDNDINGNFVFMDGNKSASLGNTSSINSFIKNISFSNWCKKERISPLFLEASNKLLPSSAINSSLSWPLARSFWVASFKLRLSELIKLLKSEFKCLMSFWTV